LNGNIKNKNFHSLLGADEILSAVVMSNKQSHTQLRAFHLWYMIQGKQEARLDQWTGRVSKSKEEK
jgi:hypothetical protein